jgi:hypothetical protein
VARCTALASWSLRSIQPPVVKIFLTDADHTEGVGRLPPAAASRPAGGKDYSSNQDCRPPICEVRWNGHVPSRKPEIRVLMFSRKASGGQREGVGSRMGLPSRNNNPFALLTGVHERNNDSNRLRGAVQQHAASRHLRCGRHQLEKYFQLEAEGILDATSCCPAPTHQREEKFHFFCVCQKRRPVL